MPFWQSISAAIAGMVDGAILFAQSIGVFLGAQATVTSWGVSSAFLVGGGVIIVGAIVIGGVTYYVLTRKNDDPNQNQNPPPRNPPRNRPNLLVNPQPHNPNPQVNPPAHNNPQTDKLQNWNNPQIEQVVVQEPINLQQIDIDLAWEPITMTLEEYNDLEVFTIEQFDQEMSEFICHVGTMQVMRKPCQMRCCKDSQREHKWAEKELLRFQIRNRGRCLLCQDIADETFIEFDRHKYATILGYRQMLVKIYRQASAHDKPIWKQLIDSKFGLGYTDEHLENFQFAQPARQPTSVADPTSTITISSINSVISSLQEVIQL